MKKFIALFCVSLALIVSQTTISLSFFSKNFQGTYTFFSTQNFEDEKVSSTKNGNGFLISCENEDAEIIFGKLNSKKIDGESFCVNSNSFNTKNFLKKLNAKIVKTERLETLYITYAFSPRLPKSVFVNGKKVNLQIVKNKDTLTIGTPLVLGSF